MSKGIKTILKAFCIYNIAGWYLYGLSESLLKTAKNEAKVKRSGGKLKMEYRWAFITTFRNFKEFFRTMKEV